MEISSGSLVLTPMNPRVSMAQSCTHRARFVLPSVWPDLSRSMTYSRREEREMWSRRSFLFVSSKTALCSFFLPAKVSGTTDLHDMVLVLSTCFLVDRKRIRHDWAGCPVRPCCSTIEWLALFSEVPF